LVFLTQQLSHPSLFAFLQVLKLEASVASLEESRRQLEETRSGMEGGMFEGEDIESSCTPSHVVVSLSSQSVIIVFLS